MADEKIRQLTEQLRNLEMENSKLQSGMRQLEMNIKELQLNKTASELAAKETVRELTETKEATTRLTQVHSQCKEQHLLCETKLSNETALVLRLEAELGLLRNEILRHKQSLEAMADLEAKTREQEHHLARMTEASAAVEVELKSCQGDLLSANASLERCRKDVLTEEVLKGKLQELHKINYDLTTRNGELKKEVFRCEQDRSIYHIRMKEAEEELSKLKKHPFDEQTLE